MSAAQQVLAHAELQEPTLGAGRLVCVDGLAGAGKTTLAAGIKRLRPEAVVIGTDDLLEGWSGLPTLADHVEALLRPLAAEAAGRWRRWDWLADDWAEWHEVEPAPLLVLEGVGSGPLAVDELITTLVWVEAPRDVRLDRGLARDGLHQRLLWEQWLLDERLLHERDRTRERADVVVDTSPADAG